MTHALRHCSIFHFGPDPPFFAVTRQHFNDFMERCIRTIKRTFTYKFILSSIPCFNNLLLVNMNQNFMMNLLAFAVLLLDLKLHVVVYSGLIYTHCVSTVEVFHFHVFGLGHLIELMHA